MPIFSPDFKSSKLLLSNEVPFVSEVYLECGQNSKSVFHKTCCTKVHFNLISQQPLLRVSLLSSVRSFVLFIPGSAGRISVTKGKAIQNKTNGDCHKVMVDPTKSVCVFQNCHNISIQDITLQMHMLLNFQALKKNEFFQSFYYLFSQ